jgi:DNA adenine methylase
MESHVRGQLEMSIDQPHHQALPPLKWAGGKRWLMTTHRDLFPKQFKNYIEPFVGSAAAYFAINPKRALLADKNIELVNFYNVLKSEPENLRKKMLIHSNLHSRTYYYKLRQSKPRTAVGRAAKFLYLNRTCWNGLYRENRRGEFNVPIGTKTSVILESDDFHRISHILSNTEIVASDFEPIIGQAQSGDLIFVDPPYTVAHNNNGFVKYNQKIFSWDDQLRLAANIKCAVRRGVLVVVTNASHDSVRDLYREFRQSVVARPSVIAGSSSARSSYQEVVVQCY